MNEHRTRSRTVVIVGGGFSGAAVARHLLARGDERLQVVLVDDAPALGRGLAYATPDPWHLLNVPAGRLGLDAHDEPGFARWLAAREPARRASDFVPRHLFGDYVAAELEQARRGARAGWQRLAARAREVRRGDATRFAVELQDGRVIGADSVVLATGHLPPRLPPFAGTATWADGAMVADPWRAGPGVPATQDVLPVGSGLTAVDTVARLRGQGHAGRVHLLSRRGLLPQPHRPNELQPPARELRLEALAAAASLRERVAAVRREMALHERAGGDWRDVMAGLRRLTPALWQALGARERRQFLRHLLPFWDTHRHRVAHAVHGRLSAWFARGDVQVLRGRLVAIDRRPDGQLDVSWRGRGGQGGSRLVVGQVVNCTGPGTDLVDAADPVLCGLHAAGLLRADGLGLQVDARLQVLDRQGHAVPGLHYVGPLLKSQFWEAVAVPELRVHARDAAQAILAEQGDGA